MTDPRDASPNKISDPAFDPAQLELLGQFLTYWRGALTALAVVTVATYWAGLAKISPSAAGVWLACALSTCLFQAAVCRAMESTTSLSEAMRLWHRWLVASIALNGLFWGLAPWWLVHAGSEAVWLAALLDVMLLFCIASSPGTSAMIWGSVPPIAALGASALVASGVHPALAAGYAGLVGMIGFYGLRLNATRLQGLRERFAAQDLASELQRKQGELRAQQARLVSMERERTLLLERQRLMRDMHDGLGAALVSTLAAAQRGEADPEQVAALLLDCIDDLRAVIESLEPHSHDLTSLLGSMRRRLDRRTQAAGMVLTWRVDDLPPLHWMGPTEALQVMRFIQEAVSNSVKHSAAHHLELLAQMRGNDVMVRICDDGGGFETDPPPGGRGLASLQQRAQQLGGSVEIRSTAATGTSVSLILPAHRQQVRAGEAAMPPVISGNAPAWISDGRHPSAAPAPD